MSDLVAKVYEYRDLRGRRDLLRMSLPPKEAERLAVLERLFAWRPDPHDVGAALLPRAVRRRFARLDVRIPALLQVAGEEWRITIVNLGAGGLVVDYAPELHRGELAMVAVRAGCRERRFPCRVVWRRPRPTGASLGLQFVGVPIELR